MSLMLEDGIENIVATLEVVFGSKYQHHAAVAASSHWVGMQSTLSPVGGSAGDSASGVALKAEKLNMLFLYGGRRNTAFTAARSDPGLSTALHGGQRDRQTDGWMDGRMEV